MLDKKSLQEELETIKDCIDNNDLTYTDVDKLFEKGEIKSMVMTPKNGVKLVDSTRLGVTSLNSLINAIKHLFHHLSNTTNDTRYKKVYQCFEKKKVSLEIDFAAPEHKPRESGKVYFSYYYSQRGKEIRGEVLEIKSDKEVYLYCMGKYYSGEKVSTNARPGELTIFHLKKRISTNTENVSTESNIDVRYYIYDNGQLVNDEGKFYPSMFCGITGSGYLRVYRGLLFKQPDVKIEGANFYEREKSFAQNLQQAILNLEPSISHYLFDKRFNVQRFDQIREFDQLANHSLLATQAVSDYRGFYEVFFHASIGIQKGIIYIRKDLIVYARTPRKDWKGFLLSKKSILHLKVDLLLDKLNIPDDLSITWKENRPLSESFQRDFGDEGVETHYYLPKNPSKPLEKGIEVTFMSSIDNVPISGSCFLRKLGNNYQEIKSQSLSPQEFRTEEHIRQLLSSDQDLKEFFFQKRQRVLLEDDFPDIFREEK